MAIPKRLSDSLHQSLGDAAGADMVNWMQIADDERSRTEALRGDIAELRQHMTAGFATMRAEAAEREARIVARFEGRLTDLGARTDERFTDFASRMDERFTGFASHMDERFTGFASHTDERFTGLVSRVEERFSDVIKWSFIFWATTTLTLVGLILSRT